jgi:anaerobic ribonucleoside-triphosphate reductase activating protein
VNGPGESRRGATPRAVRLRVHAIEPRSAANGPGTRFVIWFQGCGRGCPGCFNPRTHHRDGGEVVEVETLLRRIEDQQEEIDGVSISGGEPFEQPESLLALAAGLRSRTDLPLLIFSGFALEEIRGRPLGAEILERTDVLIDGPYVQDLGPGDGLRGSANQRVHLLGDRCDIKEQRADAVAELVIGPTGRISISGLDPPIVPDGA